LFIGFTGDSLIASNSWFLRWSSFFF